MAVIHTSTHTHTNTDIWTHARSCTTRKWPRSSWSLARFGQLTVTLRLAVYGGFGFGFGHFIWRMCLALFQLSYKTHAQARFSTDVVAVTGVVAGVVAT